MLRWQRGIGRNKGERDREKERVRKVKHSQRIKTRNMQVYFLPWRGTSLELKTASSLSSSLEYSRHIVWHVKQSVPPVQSQRQQFTTFLDVS